MSDRVNHPEYLAPAFGASLLWRIGDLLIDLELMLAFFARVMVCRQIHSFFIIRAWALLFRFEETNYTSEVNQGKTQHRLVHD